MLNIGCGDNPAGVGDVQLDIISTDHKNFIQGHAAFLPFKERTFDTAILGDVLEHVLFPGLVVLEASRVTRLRLVMTLPYDFRFPVGQHKDPDRARAKYNKTINTFNDRWILEMIAPVDMRILDWQYSPEEDWMNWLICLER